jgi:S1-C subfamily serine protease
VETQGALVNTTGELVGINSQILSPSGGGSVGVGFAIPVNTAKRVIPQILQFGEVRRPKLGVDVGEMNERDVAQSFEGQEIGLR